MKWPVAVLASLLGATALACSTADDTAIDASATSIAVEDTSQEIALDIRPQLTDSTSDPFAVFPVVIPTDVAATSSRSPLWLINQSAETMIVTADGGAGIVVVDTIGAADSALVIIDTRALSVELAARTASGVSLGRSTLRLDSEPRRAAFPR